MGSTFYSKADKERDRIKSPVQYSELNGAFTTQDSSKMFDIDELDIDFQKSRDIVCIGLTEVKIDFFFYPAAKILNNRSNIQAKFYITSEEKVTARAEGSPALNSEDWHLPTEDDVCRHIIYVDATENCRYFLSVAPLRPPTLNLNGHTQPINKGTTWAVI